MAVVIGYNQIGTTPDNIYDGYWRAFKITPDEDIRVDKLTIYVTTYESGTYYKGVIVADSDKTIVSNGVSPAVSDASYGTPHWHDIPYTNKPVLIGGNSYWVGWIPNKTVTWYYTDGLSSSYAYGLDNTNSHNSPTDPTDGSYHTTVATSIYATFTESAGVTIQASIAESSEASLSPSLESSGVPLPTLEAVQENISIRLTWQYLEQGATISVPLSECSAAGIDSIAVGVSVEVTDYWQSGDTSWNAAIGRAHTALTSLGGGTLLFPEDDYLVITTSTMTIPSNVKWHGVGTARLYTQATAVWNYFITTGGNEGVEISHLIFDHRGDDALLPTVSPYKACMTIYASGEHGINIHDCTFYTYGIVGAYCDYWNNVSPARVDYYNNIMYFQRKVDTWYDTSPTHLQAKYLNCHHNYMESIPTAFTYWKARSGYELHFADGRVEYNESKGNEVGILYNCHPSHATDYDDDYERTPYIGYNTISRAIIGFELWLGIGLAGANQRNLTLEHNTIGLYLSSTEKPAAGVMYYLGGSNSAEALDAVIKDNDITFTWDTGAYVNYAAVRSAMHRLMYGENTGAYCLNISRTIRRLEISGGTVTGFPYSLFNLVRRNSSSGTYRHVDISFHDVTAVDCAYAEPYPNLGDCKGCFIFGAVNGVSAIDSDISNPNTTLLAQKEEQAYITDLTFNNTFT